MLHLLVRTLKRVAGVLLCLLGVYLILLEIGMAISEPHTLNATGLAAVLIFVTVGVGMLQLGRRLLRRSTAPEVRGAEPSAQALYADRDALFVLFVCVAVSLGALLLRLLWDASGLPFAIMLSIGGTVTSAWFLLKVGWAYDADASDAGAVGFLQGFALALLILAGNIAMLIWMLYSGPAG